MSKINYEPGVEISVAALLEHINAKYDPENPPAMPTDVASVTNNGLWVDYSDTSPVLMIKTETGSISIGKPKPTRSIREVADGVPNYYWQLSPIASGRTITTGINYIVLTDGLSIHINSIENGQIVTGNVMSLRCQNLKTFTFDRKQYVMTTNYAHDVLTIVRINDDLSLTHILTYDGTSAGIGFAGITGFFEESGMFYIITSAHPSVTANKSSLIKFDGSTVTVVDTLDKVWLANSVISIENGKRLICGTTAKPYRAPGLIYSVTTTGFTLLNTLPDTITNRIFTIGGNVYVSSNTPTPITVKLNSDGTLDMSDKFDFWVSPSWQDPVLGYIYIRTGTQSNPILSMFDGYELVTKEFSFDSLGSRVLSGSHIFEIDGVPHYISVRATDTTNGRLYRLEY